MAKETLFEALEVEPLFELDQRFQEAFWEFGYRLISLQRYWEFTRTFIHGYLERQRSTKMDGSGEMSVARDEVLYPDQDYFPEFLRATVLAQGLALLENLLSDVANDVASDLGESVELDERKLPYVNRYILFLTRRCGLEINIEGDLWKRLDAIRELRNRYIHKLDRDLPNQMRETLERMVSELDSSTKPIDDSFVDSGLRVVAELAKAVEKAYWQFADRRES